MGLDNALSAEQLLSQLLTKCAFSSPIDLLASCCQEADLCRRLVCALHIAAVRRESAETQHMHCQRQAIV
jgi:hypothetical protein